MTEITGLLGFDLNNLIHLFISFLNLNGVVGCKIIIASAVKPFFSNKKACLITDSELEILLANFFGLNHFVLTPHLFATLSIFFESVLTTIFYFL